MVNLLLENFEGKSDEVWRRERTGAFNSEDEMIVHAIDLNAIIPLRVMDKWACSTCARIDDNGNFRLDDGEFMKGMRVVLKIPEDELTDLLPLLWMANVHQYPQNIIDCGDDDKHLVSMPRLAQAPDRPEILGTHRQT